jgi:hypothetical protein
MNPLDLIEQAHSLLASELPEHLSSLLALEEFNSAYKITRQSEGTIHNVSFGTHQVPIEELLPGTWASATSIYSTIHRYKILPDGSRLQTYATFEHKYDDDERAILHLIGKLKVEASTYETLQC